MGHKNINVRAYRKSCRKLSQIECPSTEKCPLLTQGQQVEMCYMSLEQSETAFKKNYGLQIANPSSSSAGLEAATHPGFAPLESSC